MAKKLGVAEPVTILAMAMTTDRASSFETRSMLDVVGRDMTKKAAGEVYAQSGLGPRDFSVMEVHDCFTTNELITYEAMGLCDEGQGGKLVMSERTTYGGQWVVNPSGGLLSKGHPLGATGLAQCFELSQQLRGRCDKRQVEGARRALSHNLGLGGACVMTAYGVG
jgi:acetyl-CoA acetyltransferase